MDIFLVQMTIARGKPALNRAKVSALTATLRPGKPSIVILPELFSTGYLDDTALEGAAAALQKVADEDRDFLASLARKLGCWIAGTTVEAGPQGADGNGGYRNLSLIYGPDGAEKIRYRKIHPFSYGGEDRLFSKGNEIVTVDIEDWVVQPVICYDLRFPEIFRAGSLRGTHLIIVQANWPQARQAHWEILLKARAIENQAFVAGVNCTGTQDAVRYVGGSLILSPKGEVVAHADAAEGVVRGQMDLAACKQWRKQFPALRDRMPWDFYQP